VLNVMAWTKAKTAVAVGISILLAAGTTIVTVKKISRIAAARTVDDSWRVRYFNSRVLDTAQPQVRIVPAKYGPGGYGSSSGMNGLACMGIGTPVESIIATAYHESSFRMIFPPDMPKGNYDFIAKLPPGARPQEVFGALQEELKKTFGLVAHSETREREVLLLTAQNRDRPGLKTPAHRNGASSTANAGEIRLENQSVRALASYLESIFQQPVIDQTGIDGDFDITLKWNEKDWNHRNPEGLKQALSDELGLELVPNRQPIEVLVVEKAN
jgi:uncharacterized protein (TIGR03435 family)